MPGRWGPSWDAVARCLAELGWADARPLREVREGGYSPASRWIVARADGVRAFVKAREFAPGRADDPWFVTERMVCAAAPGPMLPVLHGWHEASGERDRLSVLVLEDLSEAAWGTPLASSDADALRAALDALEAAPAPAGLRRLAAEGTHPGAGWAAIAADPEPFARTGLAPASWLERHVEALRAAAERLRLDGDGLVHGDLWLQNWCRAERGAVLVDWTGASVGNPRSNHAWGEAGVRAAGGPGGRVLGPADPDHDAWAAWMAGLAASFLAEDMEHADELPRLHATQAREALATLAWACEALELEPPAAAPQLLRHGPWQP